MNIPQIYEKIKTIAIGERTSDILLGTAVLLFGILAFGLGQWTYLSSRNNSSGAVTITDTVSIYKTAPMAFYTGTQENLKNISTSSGSASVITSQSSVREGYIASKNGTKYYPSNCSGGNRIKPENAIWFATEIEAQKSGYELSLTCK